MKSNPIRRWLLATITAAIIAGVWWQKIVLDDLHAALAAAQKEEKALSAALASHAPANAATSSSATRAPDHRDVPSSASSTPARNVGAELANDTRLQTLQLAARRAGIGARYSPLFAALELNEAQRAVFRDAIAARDETSFDINGVREARQLAPDDPALLALKSQADAKLQEVTELTAGPVGYAELQQFEKTLPIRDFVNDLVGRSILSAAPVDARTAAALVTSIDHETGGVYRLEQIVEAAARVVEKNLSPEQQIIAKAMINENRGKRTLRGLATK